MENVIIDLVAETNKIWIRVQFVPSVLQCASVDLVWLYWFGNTTDHLVVTPVMDRLTDQVENLEIFLVSIYNSFILKYLNSHA